MGSRIGYDWSWKADKVYNFNDPDTPKQLLEFRDKWAKKFQESESEPRYYEKYAGFVFEYGGRAYKVSAGEFGESSSVFSMFSYEMQNELIEMGAEKVFYTGMLD